MNASQPMERAKRKQAAARRRSSVRRINLENLRKKRAVKAK